MGLVKERSEFVFTKVTFLKKLYAAIICLYTVKKDSKNTT